ncbi:MAG: hypothetical protein ACRDZM_12740 [Acidimicrobiia bacterium]
MSRYMLNKLMWEVDRSDDALAAFKGDASAFLAGWEAKIEHPVPPYPEGGTLSDDERAALESRDYGALYAMGANPFLLWQFARAVSVPEEMGPEDLIGSFRKAVTPHGYPDFHT